MGGEGKDKEKEKAPVWSIEEPPRFDLGPTFTVSKGFQMLEEQYERLQIYVHQLRDGHQSVAPPPPLSTKPAPSSALLVQVHSALAPQSGHNRQRGTPASHPSTSQTAPDPHQIQSQSPRRPQSGPRSAFTPPETPEMTRNNTMTFSQPQNAAPWSPMPLAGVEQNPLLQEAHLQSHHSSATGANTSVLHEEQRDPSNHPAVKKLGSEVAEWFRHGHLHIDAATSKEEAIAVEASAVQLIKLSHHLVQLTNEDPMHQEMMNGLPALRTVLNAPAHAGLHEPLFTGLDQAGIKKINGTVTLSHFWKMECARRTRFPGGQAEARSKMPPPKSSNAGDVLARISDESASDRLTHAEEGLRHPDSLSAHMQTLLWLRFFHFPSPDIFENMRKRALDGERSNAEIAVQLEPYMLSFFVLEDMMLGAAANICSHQSTQAAYAGKKHDTLHAHILRTFDVIDRLEALTAANSMGSTYEAFYLHIDLLHRARVHALSAMGLVALCQLTPFDQSGVASRIRVHCLEPTLESMCNTLKRHKQLIDEAHLHADAKAQQISPLQRLFGLHRQPLRLAEQRAAQRTSNLTETQMKLAQLQVKSATAVQKGSTAWWKRADTMITVFGVFVATLMGQHVLGGSRGVSSPPASPTTATSNFAQGFAHGAAEVNSDRYAPLRATPTSRPQGQGKRPNQHEL